jgi:hypothetical protein
MSGQQGESPSGTAIRNYTDLPIIDQYGNMWALSQSAQIMIDGVIDRGTANVTELQYINRVFWQWVASKRLWWSKTSPLAAWLPPQGTPNAPIGPAPDPRLDQILAAVASLTTADAASTGTLSGQLAQLHADVLAIPTEIPTDPRIPALIASVSRGFTADRAAIADLSTKMDVENALLGEWWTTLLARLDTIDAANRLSASKQDAIAGQVARLIVMILDLFPGAGTSQIVANTSNATHTRTQPVPTDPGP